MITVRLCASCEQYRSAGDGTPLLEWPCLLLNQVLWLMPDEPGGKVSPVFSANFSTSTRTGTGLGLGVSSKLFSLLDIN